MLAAGWGGVGSVAGIDVSACMVSNSQPHRHPHSYHSAIGADFSPIEIPAVMRRRALRSYPSNQPMFAREADAGRMPVTLEAIARAVADHLAHGGQVRGLAAVCDALILHPAARRAIDEAVREGLSLEHAWLLLAHWINTRRNGLADADFEKLTAPLVSAMDPALVEAGIKILERCLGGYPVDGWRTPRAKRLHHALGRV
jgi:hypothetical protein